MVQVHGFEHMKRFAEAARALVEGDQTNAAEGRFSKTIFMSAVGSGSDVEECAIQSAAGCGIGLVALEFGTGSKARGPRAFTVAMPAADGGADISYDCALALGDGGRAILVPRGAATPVHFAIGPDGLERRDGRPASISAGMVRAQRRLIALAKRAKLDQPSLTIHSGFAAAA